MANENSFLHRISKAIKAGACIASALLGTALLFSFSLSFVVYTSEIGKIKLWCSVNSACLRMPAMFSSPVLLVSKGRQSDALAMLASLTDNGLVPKIVRFPSFQLEIEIGVSQKPQDLQPRVGKKKGKK